ncbi:MAG: maleylacetoacetate isomerase [Zoogloeaceae bacterium]|nr:maleylacetoacetate isomerase [Zoogloeaceae bacterium]
MRLYTYFRSSAAYRVRVALNLKGLAWEAVPVHLLRGGGEHHQPDYLALNPNGLVPALDDDGLLLTQSLAIIEYLDETHPEPALLPGDAAARARIRAIAQTIACDIHPINNLRVLRYLTRELGATEAQKTAWYRHWTELGLAAVESMLTNDTRTGVFCHGDSPTLADCCLVPQVFNARRFACDLSAMPTLLRIVERCEAMEAFRLAAPEHQSDAE